MSAPFILAIQTKGTAILVIVALLLVASAIGFLIAWFYSKSIYEKKIQVLEAEKDALNDQIAGLNAEVKELKEQLSAKEAELVELKNKEKPKS